MRWYANVDGYLTRETLNLITDEDGHLVLARRIPLALKVPPC